MSTTNKLHFDTLAIHGEHEEKDINQALNQPLYLTSTFTFEDIQQADDTFSFKRKAYVYTRGGNPSINQFEKRMALLENGADGVAFASGMAAITSTLLSFAKQGDTIIAHQILYGSAFGVMKKLFPKLGINVQFVNLTNPDFFAEEIKKYPSAKVVYFETPTNPALEIIDIVKISNIAKQYNVKVVIDSTFTTPYFQKPLDLGADVVVHSATKYIGGHGDVLGGVAVAKDEAYIADLKFNYMCELGGVISPFNAWLLTRGLKTLSLRMEKHAKNAKNIADFLITHPKITKVIYPGLPSHKNHLLAKQQMSGFGGIISFELDGDIEDAKQFIKNLKHIKLAVSLGDTETLIEIPALMTHKDYSEKELNNWGFSKKTVRISAGLENHEDIIEDINSALKLLNK